ncbi:MAG: hypothetical protein WBX01_04740 [Nitrososphaeraceae archaeon]
MEVLNLMRIVVSRKLITSPKQAMLNILIVLEGSGLAFYFIQDSSVAKRYMCAVNVKVYQNQTLLRVFYPISSNYCTLEHIALLSPDTR